jgi:hypothetical protein
MKRFPDNDEDGMKATVKQMVPKGLAAKNITVKNDDKGYWIPAGKTKKTEKVVKKTKKTRKDEDE